MIYKRFFDVILIFLYSTKFQCEGIFDTIISSFIADQNFFESLSSKVLAANIQSYLSRLQALLTTAYDPFPIISSGSSEMQQGHQPRDFTLTVFIKILLLGILQKSIQYKQIRQSQSMFLTVYTLKSFISIGIVITLLLGIILLYVLVYAFLVSSVTAQILPDFRNSFIAIFMTASVMMMLSSLSGIYGLIRKQNKFVIIYSVTMLFYFIVFIVLAVFMIEQPKSLKNQCRNNDPTISSIRQAVAVANDSLGKSCQCYFNNIGDYNQQQRQKLYQLGFQNYTDVNENNTFPVNAENCQDWDNQTFIATNSLIFLQSVFNCSGWCQVPQDQNLYFLFTDVNRGIPQQTCIQSLLRFFNNFGRIMLISCLVISLILFLILMTILCLCCHPDRGQEYDAMKFFKTTLIVQLNQQNEDPLQKNRGTI